MPFGKIAQDASLTIHQCSICGCSGRKGVETRFFGSLADAECGTTVVICDTECAKKFAETPHRYYTPMKPRGYDYTEDHITAKDVDAIRRLVIGS